jgi:hypothetical protein
MYLVEAYRRLTDRGILLVLLGPYENGGNVINTITGVIDEVLASQLKRTKETDLYEEKIITEDPYRNYAEDIAGACEAFFGRRGHEFGCASIEQWIEAREVLNSSGLSERGKEVVELFLHGYRTEKPKLFEMIFKKLKETQRDVLVNGNNSPGLPAWEWDFPIGKDRLFLRSQRELRLITSGMLEGLTRESPERSE